MASSSSSSSSSSLSPPTPQTEQLITINTRIPVINNAVPFIWCHKDGMFCTLYGRVNRLNTLDPITIMNCTNNWLTEMELDSVFEFCNIEKTDHVIVSSDSNSSPRYIDVAVMLDKIRERYVIKLKRVQ
jgi:hypothetical protein